MLRVEVVGREMIARIEEPIKVRRNDLLWVSNSRRKGHVPVLYMIQGRVNAMKRTWGSDKIEQQLKA